MITGVLDYTAEEFRANTLFIDEDAFAIQYDWLFEIIDEMNPEQRSKFLKFVTSLENLPIGGFEMMKSKPKVEMLLNVLNPDEKLPEASTCFSNLQLYPYSTKEILKNKLILAIEEGNSFGKA